jgi:hypothetical protein
MASSTGNESRNVVDSADRKNLRHGVPSAPQVMKPLVNGPVADDH